MSLHFRAFKSAVSGYGIALAHGADNMLTAFPDQWGRIRSYGKGENCPAILWAGVSHGHMFDKLKAARLEVVNSYPKGQRRFGMKYDQARLELCDDLAAHMNRTHKAWIMELAKLVTE